MFQAGIKNITLYERKGVSYYFYNPLNGRAITDLNNAGEQIAITNEQLPTFNVEDISRGDGGEVLINYTLTFKLLGYSGTNIDTINKLKRSIYGWAVMLELYDGTFKFFDVPFMCDKSSLNPNEEMAFSIEMNNSVPTKEQTYDLTPGLTLYSVFTADSTLITADSTTDTADFDIT